jgi:outer membrane protein
MKYIFSILILGIGIHLQAQNGAPWDLKTCVEYAIQHNISIQQADVQARLAKLQAQFASSNRLPTINGSTGAGLRLGRSIDPTTNGFSNTQFLFNNFGLNGGVQIFNAGKLRNNAEASNFSWLASETDKQTISNDISMSVATFYLQVLSAIEQSEITKIQIQQTLEQLNATKKRVEVGVLPEINLLELETQLANDSSNYIGAISNVIQTKLSLKALLNLDASSEFDVLVQPVENIKECNIILEDIRRKYNDASHNCWAYSSYGGYDRSSDDGEPTNSAGKPILQSIKTSNIANCLVIVTRYFGGIELGVGGLIRAYSSSSKKSEDG